jgi:hypothetical protein
VPTTNGSAVANPQSMAGTLANTSLNGHNYYLNDAFNAASLRLPYPSIPCLAGIALQPAFTATNPINAGEPVGFDGMESNITLNSTTSYPSGANTYAVFTWNFGDGSPTVTGFAPGSAALNSPNATPCEAPWLSPCADSTFHSYQYGGVYTVTLTAKDVGGNVASTTREIAVSGPAPPTPEHKESGGGSTTQTTTSGGGTSTPAPTPADKGVKPAAGPVVATQAVVSHSLTSVLKSGLTVRYSVNEQVAGRFEVLLASSIARKLGIHGAAATGLAKGTPAQTIIGKAVLVTTKGGRGTYRLKLSSAVSKRLRKLRKVTLMVRLVVHNAASPAPTTVLNTVNLSR